VVAVVHNADRLSLNALAAALSDKAERARNGTLAMEDVEGGTFTVSNLGMYGVDGGFPLPRPPEGAILLVGSARPKPAVVADEVTIRDIGWFSLSFDHRFIDGAAAAAFLQDLNTCIANPDSLLREPDQTIG
jgi:pyruvate dehydrogenase E2 component (dihydrolipoamide acetyltransferase)